MLLLPHPSKISIVVAINDFKNQLDFKKKILSRIYGESVSLKCPCPGAGGLFDCDSPLVVSSGVALLPVDSFGMLGRCLHGFRLPRRGATVVLVRQEFLWPTVHLKEVYTDSTSWPEKKVLKFFSKHS